MKLTASKNLSLPRKCLNCGGDYIAVRSFQKHCGKKCSSQWSDRLAAERKAAEEKEKMMGKLFCVEMSRNWLSRPLV